MRTRVFSIVNYWQGVKGGMESHGKLLSEGLVNGGLIIVFESNYYSSHRIG